jgi:hypothetical protein
MTEAGHTLHSVLVSRNHPGKGCETPHRHQLPTGFHVGSLSRIPLEECNGFATVRSIHGDISRNRNCRNSLTRRRQEAPGNLVKYIQVPGPEKDAELSSPDRWKKHATTNLPGRVLNSRDRDGTMPNTMPTLCIEALRAVATAPNEHSRKRLILKDLSQSIATVHAAAKSLILLGLTSRNQQVPP